MFSHARATAKEARIGTLRDLDAAALLLRDAGAVLLDPDTADGDVRAAVFAGIERGALAGAVEQITLLAVPSDATYFAEFRQHPGKIRYLPALLSGIEFAAAPAGKPLLDAVEHLRALQRGARKPGPAPTAFAPKALGQATQDERWGVRSRGLPAGDGRPAASRDPSPRRVPGPIAPLCRSAQDAAQGSRLGEGAAAHLPHGRGRDIGR